MSDVQRHSMYQAPADAPAPISSYQAARQCGETLRATFTDGVLTEGSDTQDRARVSDASAFAGSEGFAATARNQNGTPVTALLPTTLVTIDGVQAPISSFVAAGRLQKTADGSYSEAAAAPEVAPNDASDVMPMDAQTMDAVNAALETVDQGSLDGLMAMGVAVAVNGLDPRTLDHKFTSVSGLGGEDAAQRLGTMQAAYQAQADRALMTRSGLSADDLPAFYAWAKATHRGELQQAVQRQLQSHDVSGYRALADRWFSATPPSLKALSSAGFQTRNLGSGDEVFIGGQWMSPGAAARVGLI